MTFLKTRGFVASYGAVVLALGATFSLTACVGGGRSATAAEVFVDHLNSSDPTTGYYLAKDPTRQAGYVVIQQGDGSYWAVDIRNADLYYDIDLYNANAFQVWYNTNGYYEDSYGNLFEKNTETSKDLEKVGAVISKMRARTVGEQISANYGLSESKGIELGSLLVEYKDLKKTRALTPVEEDRYLKSAFGVTASEVNKALDNSTQGDQQDLNDLIERSSTSLGTTPEHVRALVESTLLQSGGNN